MQHRLPELFQDQAWPHPVSHLQCLQTHISWVILTGEFAYKIKKPVNFGFVDYETLEARKHYCQLEVACNQRYAPELYLGVVPIYDEDGGLRVGEIGELDQGDGQAPFEFAVKMRQFPQESIVATLLQTRDLPVERVEDFGRRLADFHAAIEVAVPLKKSVQPAQVMQDALDNFGDLESFFAGDPRADLLDTWKAWTTQSAPQLVPRLQSRLESGQVRCCHGDLHLRNMICVQDRLQAFDGIEFNEALQWIDVLSELAFPVMDFQARGHSTLAWRLLNAYLESTGDYRDPQVLKFYLVYRALVCAKVTCLNPANATLEERERHATGNPEWDLRAGTWDKYLTSAQYFISQMKPKLIITFGFSGSGKSTAAMSVIDQEGGIRLRSDVERQRLARRLRSADKYSAELSEWLYDQLLELAKRNLQAGFKVVVDATFLKVAQRAPFQKLARTLAVDFEILRCGADYDELCRRIGSRKNDPSEATVEVLQMQMKTHDALTTDELQFVRALPNV